jgi:hypothetical protein
MRVRLRWGVAAAVLAYCAAAPAAGAQAPHAALPTPAQLAALAFPGWSDGDAGRVHTVQVPFGAAERNGWRTGRARVLVEPKLVLRADAGRVVLVAGLAPAGEDGRANAAQSTPMALAAYQFERQDGAWRLDIGQGIFAWRGFKGGATLRAVALSDRQQGLAVEYGSCWDGYCGMWLALFEVDKGGMRREPAVELPLSGANVAGEADCPRRLHPLVKQPAQSFAARSAPDTADEHDCYAIDAGWTVEGTQDRPGALVVHYQGAISRAGTRLSPPVVVDQRQVLRYGSGKYRAVSGFNPVPPI